MLNPSQMILSSYILARVQKDKREEAKILIKEGFDLEKEGKLSKEYLLSKKETYLELVKPQAKEELIKALDKYINTLS